MSVYPRGTDKRRVMQEYHLREEEIAVALGRQMSPKGHLEQEKKLRREIANSNERRRMQSINAGFQSLRAVIPHHEGEKLSKAAILQQTTEYIQNLQQEKAKVLAQNAHFKRLLSELSRRCNVDLDLDISLYGSPPTKRKKRDTESSDEGITADFDDYSIDTIRREMAELRHQLDRERRLRVILEDQSQALEKQLYTERTPQVPDHDETRIKHYERLYHGEEEMKAEEAVHTEPEPDQELPASPQAYRRDATDSSSSSSSMSRRNLETIVEAIRHLEGQEVPMEEHRYTAPRPVPNSEESERESSIVSDGDVKSDSSGRDSPSTVHYIEDLQNYSSSHASQQASSHQESYHTKYPIVTNVLHGNTPQPQFYYRPGVIVQKS